MSLVLIEGWDSLASVNDKYTTVGSPLLSSSIKRTGSQSVGSSGYAIDTQLPMPSAQDTYIFGTAIYVVAFAEVHYNAPQIHFFRNGLINIRICIGGTGYIRVYRSSTLLATSSAALSVATWHYLEIKATCKNSISADDFVIKLDGLEIVNLSATTDTQESATSGIDEVRLSGLYPGNYVYFDDIYICDLLGGVNDDFLGDVKVETLYPNGNGNTNQFVGSDSDSINNYLLVDEAQQNEDTDYVEHNTVSELDLYTFDDMAVTPASIKGVGVRTYVKKSDAGSRTGKLQCRRSAANYEGDEFFPASNYLGKDHIWEVDPSTASAWTEAGVNAAEFGIKVQS